MSKYVWKNQELEAQFVANQPLFTAVYAADGVLDEGYEEFKEKGADFKPDDLPTSILAMSLSANKLAGEAKELVPLLFPQIHTTLKLYLQTYQALLFAQDCTTEEALQWQLNARGELERTIDDSLN